MNQAKFVDSYENTVDIIVVNLSEVCSLNLWKGTTVAGAVCRARAGAASAGPRACVREMRGNINITTFDDVEPRRNVFPQQVGQTLESRIRSTTDEDRHSMFYNTATTNSTTSGARTTR